MSTTRPRPSLLAVVAAGIAISLPNLANAQAQHQHEQKDAAPQRAHETHEVTLAALPATSTLATLEDLVGKTAFDFTLTDTEGNKHTLSDSLNAGKIVVLEWFNPTCPYVVSHYTKSSTMNDLVAKYGDDNVVWLAINSGSDRTGDSTLNETTRKKWNMAHPILLDPTGAVGLAYGSKNTPTMVVIAADGTIAYGGGIDNNGSFSKPDPTNYVEIAIDALLAGSHVETGFAKPYGCAVKYSRK